jgi:hypothetical protein
MRTHDEIIAEAQRRHPHNHTVDDPFGETGEAQSDPYGYEETARLAFIAGGAFALEGEPAPVEGDEREALARAIFIASDDFAFADRMAKAWDAPGTHGRARWYNYADAILAAGFRRPSTPTEEDVERAARAIWRGYVGPNESGFDKPTFAHDREKALAVARAALSAVHPEVTQ